MKAKIYEGEALREISFLCGTGTAADREILRVAVRKERDARLTADRPRLGRRGQRDARGAALTPLRTHAAAKSRR